MLTLWKRHSATCKKEHQKEFKKLKPEKHRFFKNCTCACWVTGTHPITREYIKRTLDTRDWQTGEIFKARLEANPEAEIREPELFRKRAIQEAAAREANLQETEIRRREIETLYPYLSPRRREKILLTWGSLSGK